MGKACSTHGRDAECIQGFGRAARPLGRSRCRWEDNIKIDLRETTWGGTNWIRLAQDGDQWQTLVNIVTNL
jgi:hypothetical protein